MVWLESYKQTVKESYELNYDISLLRNQEENYVKGMNICKFYKRINGLLRIKKQFLHNKNMAIEGKENSFYCYYYWLDHVRLFNLVFDMKQFLDPSYLKKHLNPSRCELF